MNDDFRVFNFLQPTVDGKHVMSIQIENSVLKFLRRSLDGTLIERLSFECRKTKTKVITLANHKEHRQYSEPIKIRSNYM